MAKITILGCGFGTALAIMWDKYGHNVTAWSKYQEEIDAIMNDGEHKRLLPGVIVPPTIRLTTDINCVSDCDILVFAIPSKFVREVAQKVKNYVKKDTIVVNVGKGFEENTDKRLSQVLKEELPDNRIAVLTGPSHAEEIGRNVPTTIVVSSEDEDSMVYLQETLQNDRFRIYRNSDLVGCELGGALKNPIALCCGIVEGMGLGDNTIAALMTRGLAEITRLGVAMGIPAAQAVKQVGTVEGYQCAKIAYAIAREHNVQVPIIEQLCEVCYNGQSPLEAVSKLMGRPSKAEEEIF